jgi:Flp pilus assembly protein TadG
MYTRITFQRGKRSRSRRGVVAVETAVVAPLLVLLFLGAVDMGQYANCYQKVSDAAREGARFAARFEVSDASQVETTVMEYLEDRFPGISESTLQGASQVTLRDENGKVITGSDLGIIESGAPVEVNVRLQYNAVRWIGGLEILADRDVQITSVMRRE